jgi:hypothetical protein
MPNVNETRVEREEVGKMIVVKSTYVTRHYQCLYEDVPFTVNIQIHPGGALRSRFVFSVGDVCT